MTRDQLLSAWKTLQQGAEGEPFPSLAVRRDRLRRLANLLEQHEQDFCGALSADYGYRSTTQSSFADITTTLKSVRHALRNLRFWMTPQHRSPDLSLLMTGASCSTRYCPKGVVGIVSPWNFPVNLSLSPLTSVLAAGNRAFIKPSEITAATSSLMAEVFPRHFNDDEIAIATGDVDVSKAFVQLPHNHLIYTGSTAVGRDIAAASAANLTPLTLELGGKCPVIVSEQADIPKLAQRLFFGKYFNGGQICIAPDTVLLPKSLLAPLIESFDKLKPAMQQANRQGDQVAVVNERHQARLDALVDDAAQHGATIVSPDPDNTLRLVIDPAPDAQIVHEEIFGPVLLIRTVNHFDEALGALKASHPPLAIYYFGCQSSEWHALSQETRSGALIFNDIIMQYANDDLPFGGVGDSGFGRYRGIDGFREFSNLRAYYKSGWINVSRLTSPPYPAAFGALNKLMRRL